MSERSSKYWRSLGEISGDPQFRQWLEREFPEYASEWVGSRRALLKLMAASFGLAGLTSCRRPEERILPAARGVEGYVPGRPLYYASIMTLAGFSTGVLIETHEGRPIKIEGNPDHPASRGAATAFAQASVLGLYDPDRSRTVLRQGRRSSWEEFEAFLAEHMKQAGKGEGLRVVSGAIGSPSLAWLKAALLDRYPAARWVEYEPLGRDEELAGAELAFGRVVQPQYRFDQADVIVSLDADFLGLDCLAPAWIRQYSDRRRVASDARPMNRLYVIETHYSLTGASADHRWRARPSQIGEVARGMARQLGVGGFKVLEPGQPQWLAAVVRDLERHRGRCLVLAGPRQPARVHALVHWINHALGNVGRTVYYTEPVVRTDAAGLLTLAAEAEAGEVKTLLVLGANPVYNAPADVGFAALLRRVPVTIHLGQEPDETAALATWHLPEAHYLESWGDGRAVDGTAAIQQPVIAPLFGGRTAAEVVAQLVGGTERRAYDIVRQYWLRQWKGPDAEQAWARALHDGVIRGTEFAALQVSPDVRRLRELLEQPFAPGTDLELEFVASSATYDGRFANNGWLQEAPDPITKLTWDNAACLSPATARALGVENGDVVELEAGERRIQAPVWVAPGQADGAVSIALGYGRTRCGRVGNRVGHNPYPLRTIPTRGFAVGVRLRKTGRRYPLVSTQEHHSMEGRPLVREATLAEFQAQPDFAQRRDRKLEAFSLFKEHSYSEGHQWAMVVDLNACIGCNACLLACQAENNIPIVGKDQVRRGREMHWIRLDRYFTGEPDDPQIAWQPMACQHCEMAPCETVCPVAATNHTPEGLNDMAYNRCIGTRYCANNCPYKVRRFNFLDY
ncbi:MAG: TAT-variant-translocated molybdopterin oxidoreductase, partial [Bryobacteraceae bacterium]|nr:TAT-variant-translocated molybdopterin oxidoreductase [Bryobacteraceae bacterium]